MRKEGSTKGQFLEDTDDFEMALKNLEEILSKNFPMGVRRCDLKKATGGILHPRTCANDDCNGQGIQGRFKIGRNTIYPIREIISFIKSKYSEPQEK